MLKNQKGITLVSLVITIVVMILLAAVAVSIVISDGSVTDHATNAGTQWNAAVNTEQNAVDNALLHLQKIPSGN